MATEEPLTLALLYTLHVFDYFSVLSSSRRLSSDPLFLFLAFFLKVQILLIIRCLALLTVLYSICLLSVFEDPGNIHFVTKIVTKCYQLVHGLF